MNSLLKLWKKGNHFPDNNEFVFVERERSRNARGKLRPMKRAFRVLKVRAGSADGIQVGDKPDERQWVTCRICFRKPKGRDHRYRWTLTEFLEKFERIK